MRAVVCRTWGEPDDLILEEVPPPEVAPGEVGIAVRAAGLNFADTLLIAGRYQTKPTLPFSPGFEVAGRIVALGDGVRELRRRGPGDGGGRSRRFRRAGHGGGQSGSFRLPTASTMWPPPPSRSPTAPRTWR